MKRLIYAVVALAFTISANAQTAQPASTNTGQSPDFTVTNQIKAPGDSCGVYWNNYVGLNKTSVLFFEAVRTGNVAEFNTYTGRGQRFHANQPIEVSGVQFYAFETNPLVDSLMAITMLYDYTVSNDSVGALLATDTVWVTHQAFSAVLPNIEVNSFFDTPVTVTSDYIISVVSPDDDSLKMVVSDFAGGDGLSEGVSFIYYDNPAYPGFTGWFNSLTLFGPGYDGDYLINPRVKFDLNDGFLLSDDTICPNVVSAACVNYTQNPIYSDVHYNGYGATPDQHNLWLWGDGFQNTNLLTACHTYTASGDYDITLNDTLRRHDFFNPTCVGMSVLPVHVISDVVANFTFTQTASTVDFMNTSSNADSVWWDFGDTTAGTNLNNPSHVYDTLATFDVWLYAYNECSVDSIMIQVTTDDVGIENNNFEFKMYPNPTANNVTLEGLSEGTRVDLLNILGEQIKTDIASSDKLILETRELSNGTYFVRLSTELGQVTKKLVVRH